MKLMDNPPVTRSKPHRGRYDWAALADGRWHLAEKGVDFERTDTFKQLPKAWVRNTGTRMQQQGHTYSCDVVVQENGDVAFRIFATD